MKKEANRSFPSNESRLRKHQCARDCLTGKETLETLIKVNNYFMKKYADYRTPSYNGIIRPSNIWTRGVYYEGLMALHSVFPREEYYDYAYQWADYHKWGMRNGILPAMRTTSVADRFISNCIISVLTRR